MMGTQRRLRPGDVIVHAETEPQHRMLYFRPFYNDVCCATRTEPWDDDHYAVRVTSKDRILVLATLSCGLALDADLYVLLPDARLGWLRGDGAPLKIVVGAG
jgi:hypothetical protein